MDSEITPSTTWYDLLGWLDTHKKRVLQVLVGVAVAVLIVSLIVWWGNEKEIEASEGLVALQLVNAREPGTSRAELLRRFASEHAGTKAGTQALLLEGGALFTENKFAEARSCFERFLGSAADSPLAVQASFGVASSLEAEGKSSEALLKYEALARLTREPLADSARLAMARIQLAQGKPEAALKIYQQLGENPTSMAAAEARLRAEQLLQKYPHLAPTNAPPKVTAETPAPTPQAK